MFGRGRENKLETMSIGPEKKLSNVVFGVRFDKLFGIQDKLGVIADNIIEMKMENLYPDNTFATIEFAQSHNGCRLLSGDKKFYLYINIENIILSYDFGSELRLNIDKCLSVFLKIASRVVEIGNIGNRVNRLGVLENYKINDIKKPAGRLVSNLTTLNLPGKADIFNMQVVYKHPTEKGLTLKSNADYKTTIIKIAADKGTELEEEEQKEIGFEIQFDCQHYYIPAISFSDEIVIRHYDYYRKQSSKLKREHFAPFFSGE